MQFPNYGAAGTKASASSMTHFDANKSIPALEFFSPLKGPNLEQICVAVGSGQMTAQQGAENYDKDVEKQAKQLGLPGW